MGTSARAVVSSLFLVGGLAGCVGSDAVICDDGQTICASFQVCAPGGGGCLFPEQLTACDGRLDGDPCDSPAGAGQCDHGICSNASCGNGIVEIGEICDDGNVLNGDHCSGTCLSDESCGNGIAELDEECDCGTDAAGGMNAVDGGASCHGTHNGGSVCSTDCTRGYCGDHIINDGEVCDDGNDVAGDKCSIHCLSDESCGNTFLDVAAGEQCDDGNHRRSDGCAVLCNPELYLWSVDEPLDVEAMPPGARASAVAVFDDARGRLVMFGASQTSDATGATTLERAGIEWLVRHPAPEPSSLTSAAAAYDSTRERVVMFGGETSGGTALSSTYAYDGTAWNDIGAVFEMGGKPSPRSGHAMAYDRMRDKFVVFGGTVGSGPTNETLLLAQTAMGPRWSIPPNSIGHIEPTARTGAAMAYDDERHQTVLFGGTDGTEFSDETFLFTTAWDIQTPTVRPPTRAFAAMAYDPDAERVVLFGGLRPDASKTTTVSLGDTWFWEPDPSMPGQMHWRELTMSPSPSIRSHAQLAWDSVRHVLVLTPGDAVTTPFTWELAGETWTPVAAQLPSRRSAAQIAYDPLRARVILFGGLETRGDEGQGFNVGDPVTRTPVGDTWERYDGSWRHVSPLHSPPPRYGGTMAYDPIRKRVVLFGGRSVDAAPYFGDTWEYDGVDWTQATPASAPSARAYTRTAWDASHGRIVLFGGTPKAGLKFADTWEWDGSTWHQATPTQSPTGRSSHAMTYDPARQRVIVAGGDTDMQTSEQLWEYDGVTWVNRTPTTVTLTAPGSLTSSTFVYDSARKRSVLIVAVVNRSSPGNSDIKLFEWDGTHWFLSPSSRFDPGFPAPRVEAAFAYDDSAHGAVMFGGSTNIGDIDATTTLGYEARDAGEACATRGDFDYDHDGLRGCADDECWAYCSPLCPPGATGTACTGPTCGDASCDPNETPASCPADCH